MRALLTRSRLVEIGVVDGGKVARGLDAPEPDAIDLAALTAMELWLRQATEPPPKAAGTQTEASEEQHGCAG